MSQYASPYSFLGGDPVNQIDETGNAGKPLILHRSDYRIPGGKDAAMLDLYSAIGDAYYVPLADFMNEKVPDMPEFNGHVYIDSHMDSEKQGFVKTERDGGARRFKTPKELTVEEFWDSEDQYVTKVRGSTLGKQLRKFADENGLEIETIIAGGCEGEVAAQRIGRGFMKGPVGKPRLLRTAGPKCQRFPVSVGQKSVASKGMTGFEDKYRWYVTGNEPVFEDIIRDGENPAKLMGLFGHSETGLAKTFPYANGEEVKDIAVNGRIPKPIESHFNNFEFEY